MEKFLLFATGEGPATWVVCLIGVAVVFLGLIALIGVIPESRRLELAQEKGKLAAELRRDKEGARAAFDETARRLCNERVPLMSYISEKKRRKLLYK